MTDFKPTAGQTVNYTTNGWDSFTTVFYVGLGRTGLHVVQDNEGRLIRLNDDVVEFTKKTLSRRQTFINEVLVRYEYVDTIEELAELLYDDGVRFN